MNVLKKPLMAAMLGVSTLGLSVAAPSETQATTTSIPIDVWALRNVVNTVQISPSGEYLLVHVNPTSDGEYLLQIFKTDDLSTPYRTLNADPMEIFTAQWVSDTVIFGNAWEIKRRTVRRQEDDIRNYASYFYDLEENEFQQVRGSFGIVNTLPNDPNEVLVSQSDSVGSEFGEDPLARFRPRSYYRLNLETGSRQLVVRGTRKYSQVFFDDEGNPRIAIGQDTDNTVKTFYRRPGESNWSQFGEVYDQDDPENLYRFLGGFQGLAGIHHEDPNLGYMIEARNGADKASLWLFNFETGEFVEELFATDGADVMGVGTHSIPGNNRLAFASYPGAKMERHWFDADEQQLYALLEEQIPYAHQLRISSRSYDGLSMVVQNTGPRDPGSFWLIRNGQLAKLGSRNPYINQEQLADVQFVRYPARDGMMIPGYVTVPNGEGPFPLIVLPHGGPAVPETVTYNEWGQMLASAGYMVLQPGYRHTVGWGEAHFMAGVGQHGRAMQDDKDDGALYLVEQGLVDPDRIAMFGWSYGGYAALASLSREDNIYQCAIAGAAVANYPRMLQERTLSGAPRAIQDWITSSYGVNPMEEVSKVNIPLLMIHPRQDRRVRYFNFTDYQEAFEEAGKSGQFLTLEEADHFSVTLMYNHQQQLYTTMLDFLANDCGPGGL